MIGITMLLVVQFKYRLAEDTAASLYQIATCLPSTLIINRINDALEDIFVMFSRWVRLGQSFIGHWRQQRRFIHA